MKNGDVQGYCWDKMNFAWSRKFYPDNFKAANVFHTLLVIVKIGKPGQKDTYVIMKKFMSSLFVFEIFSWSTLIIIICLEILRCNSLMSSKKLVRWLLCCFENTEKATFGFVVIKIRNLFMMFLNRLSAKYVNVTSICFEFPLKYFGWPTSWPLRL